MGILTDFYLRNRWSKQQRRKAPIILEVEGDRVRSTGGLYLPEEDSLFFEMRSLNVPTIGASRMRQSETGLQYMGNEEFHVPFSEIERIGIPGVLQPGTKFYIHPWVLRTLTVNPISHTKTYRVQTERTRDGYPSFTSAWDFESETPGETPTGWGVDDPGTSNVTVETESPNQVLQVKNESGPTGDYLAYLWSRDFLLGGIMSLKYDFKLEWYDTAYLNGTLGKNYGSSKSKDLGAQEDGTLIYNFTIEVIDGVVHFKSDGAEVDLQMTVGDWYSIEFKFNWKEGKIYGSVNGTEFEIQDDLLVKVSPATYVVMLASELPAGVPNIMQYDNVEVSVVDAI